MYTDFCALLSSTQIFFASQLSFTAMPSPHPADHRKKIGLSSTSFLHVLFWVLLHFLSRSSYCDQSAASLQKRCGPCFVYLFFLTLYSRKCSASTQSPSPDSSHDASSDAVLTKHVKMVAAGSPEVDALPPDVIMYVISCHYMSTCSLSL